MTAARATAAHMDGREVLAWLAQKGSRRGVEAMARYGIPNDGAFGVPMGTLLAFAKRLGKDHALAAALWKTGRYEARLLAALVDEPSRVTRQQMNAWASAFDSWAVTDTVCFHLFSRVPAAWEKARQWSSSPREFVKRGGFALMASLVLRDKAAADARFVALLPLMERGARDERNLVKKGVNWALRTVGKRNRMVHAAALATATRLAKSEEPSCRWVGKDALRELASSKVRARLARRAN
ncbi:MAG TPA: DNA alkylation repair protein [Vicinamibacteria bacterium]|nr:DNA alkylation repair protein [Vicinamibacteria bacterium]